ncbi:MAG: hypothetical protein IKH93_05350 [Bacteroidales bacterium]|nr:hypothetical protein [Bacteroidales bacterium]
MKKGLLFIAILMITTVASAQVDTTRFSRLSRDSILIGDQVELILDLQMNEGEGFLIAAQSEQLVPGVETIKGMTVDTLSVKKGKIDIQAHLTITSFDSGSYVLPPMLALIQNSRGEIDSLLYKGPELYVNTIPIDTATYEIKDIKGQIGYPVTFKEILPWLLLALLIAALVYLIIRLVNARRNNLTLFGKPVQKDPAHIVALRDLEKIRKQKLWQNNKQKQFYTAVTDTLRYYISERFGIVTMERPSGEMLEDLKKQDIEENTFDKIEKLFGRADLVKFAKYEASAEENEETIPDAVQFVNSTYVSQLEEEGGDE